MNHSYVPERWTWLTRSPQQAGFDSSAINEAIEFSISSEVGCDKPHDMAAFFDEMAKVDPHGQRLGPCKDRGATNGMILRDGYIVAEWGDTQRVDMTFSVAKSYVATMAGLALDHGLIRDLNDPISEYVHTEHFNSEHNRAISWHHILRQTSEWEGTLWDKPWYGDPQGRQTSETVLQEPGSVYAYNDVRVNLTAHALLHVWRRPLPQVLREKVMDPIGASHTWEWHGYENSWIQMDGQMMQSVSGGGHWGGGVWANTRDHARFGLLYMNNGHWGNEQILSEEWIARATTPGDINPVYGYMWWLNPDRQFFPSASPTSFCARGGGGNTIWVDRELGLVVVVRWTDANLFDGFLKRLLAALR